MQTMFKEQYPDSELTGKIIGCAMEVHKALGNGFQEVIYQRAPEIEMHLQGLDFSREHEMDFFLKEKISELEGLIFCRGENYG
jgi:GxxExxY protein